MTLRSIRNSFSVRLLVLAGAAPATSSAADAGVRVRDVVLFRTGDQLEERLREGSAVRIARKRGGVASGVAKALSDIEPGPYVGIASSAKVQGGRPARSGDLAPGQEGNRRRQLRLGSEGNSSMTNATVVDAVKSIDVLPAM